MKENKTRKIAKLITVIHENTETVKKLLNEDWIPKEKKAHVVAITGSTAAGKSTLIDKIIGVLRKDKFSVVVLAIDPTEEKSGGAVLGDAIRMRDHYKDEDVFIRSFGTRGALGALTKALPEIIDAVSRFFDFVIVETAGAGQSDVKIKNIVDTLVVLPEPRGDIVTLMKAGIHNEAHILAVNIRTEEDRKFLALLEAFAKSMLNENEWIPLVFEVNAATGAGVEKMIREGIYKHKLGGSTAK